MFNLVVEVDDNNAGQTAPIPFPVTINLSDLQATLSISDVSDGEGNGPFVFDVMLTGDDINNAFDVTYSTTDITAQDAGTGVGSNDYEGTASSTISFAGNVPSETQQISITINGDSIVEADENFFVNLLSTTSNDISFTDDTGEGTIENDDRASVTISDVSVVEGNPGDAVQFIFNVTLDNPVDTDLTFDYATQDDTAVGGQDFDATSGTLTILAGSTSGQITVDVSEEQLVELDETLTVLAGNLQAAGRDVSLVGTGTEDSTWTQLVADINGEITGDGFGTSVATSADGNTVVSPRHPSTTVTAATQVTPEFTTSTAALGSSSAAISMARQQTTGPALRWQ